jgi:hypothetical protein
MMKLIQSHIYAVSPPNPFLDSLALYANVCTFSQSTTPVFFGLLRTFPESSAEVPSLGTPHRHNSFLDKEACGCAIIRPSQRWPGA